MKEESAAPIHRGSRREALHFATVFGLKLGAAIARVSFAALRRRVVERIRAGRPAQQPVPEGTAPHLTSSDFRQINRSGFGDRWNSYPWSMLWWRDRFYVGTNRAFPCVEYYEIHKALPGIQRYPPRHDPDIKCIDPPLALPLRAELWRYTPTTDVWERIYQSPRTVELPEQGGAPIARDIGFRGMTLFTEPGGTEALYVAGVSPRAIDGRLPVPRLLRSTDGVNFAALPHDPGTVLGEVRGIGYRSFATYKERLYVTATVLYGDGVLLEAENPAGGNDQFRQVSPAGMRVVEMVPFNGFLYLGLRHPLKGYTVVKTDATGSPPYEYIPVVPFGGLRRPRWRSSDLVASMQLFNGSLYVGTDSPAELIRIDPDDHWELIVGKPRRTPEGMKRPLSGMGDGFDFDLNRIMERMVVHEGWLYIGTASNAGVKLRDTRVGRLIGPELGFDLYATSDGTHFSMITRTGFDDIANGTLRTFASTPIGLFAGGANELEGAKVYLAPSQQHAERNRAAEQS